MTHAPGSPPRPSFLDPLSGTGTFLPSSHLPEGVACWLPHHQPGMQLSHTRLPLFTNDSSQVTQAATRCRRCSPTRTWVEQLSATYARLALQQSWHALQPASPPCCCTEWLQRQDPCTTHHHCSAQPQRVRKAGTQADTRAGRNQERKNQCSTQPALRRNATAPPAAVPPPPIHIHTHTHATHTGTHTHGVQLVCSPMVHCAPHSHTHEATLSARLDLTL